MDTNLNKYKNRIIHMMRLSNPYHLLLRNRDIQIIKEKV